MIKEMPEVGKQTVSRSINRTASHTKSVVSQTVRTFTTVKAKYAKAKMIIPKKATVNSLNSKVVISGKRLPLISYMVRQTKKGVTGRIFKSGSIILYPRAFISAIPTPGGGVHQGVFWRKFESSGFLVHRLGITELTDYSIPDLVNDKRVWDDLRDEADETLKKELETNLKYFMDKYK